MRCDVRCVWFVFLGVVMLECGVVGWCSGVVGLSCVLVPCALGLIRLSVPGTQWSLWLHGLKKLLVSGDGLMSQGASGIAP